MGCMSGGTNRLEVERTTRAHGQGARQAISHKGVQCSRSRRCVYACARLVDACVCAHMYARVRVCERMHVCGPVSVFVCLCVRARVHVCAFAYARKRKRERVCAFVRARVRVYVRARVCVCTM